MSGSPRRAESHAGRRRSTTYRNDTARHAFGRICAVVDAVFDSLTRMREETVDLFAAASVEGRALGRDELSPVRPLALDALRRHDGLVVGTGVIAAADVLADAARWLEWWWSPPGQQPDLLRLNLNPDAAEFYDYTGAQWYQVPKRTLDRWAAGPYVDYLCTNEYVITLAVPVVRGGELLAVAGADVLVGQLEAAVLPVLAAIGRPAVLTNDEGRVIVSTASRWLPGTLLPDDVDGATVGGAGPRSRSAARPWAPVPWRLLTPAQ